MIIKLPKKEDELKEITEDISKKLKNNASSIQNEKERKEHLLRIKANLPEKEKEINDIINLIKTDILRCDARQILEHFSIKYSLSTNETLEKNLDSTRQFKLDYILSMVSAIGVLKDEESDFSILENISSNLEKLEMQSTIYLMLSTTNNGGKPNKMKFKQSLQNMVVRGDSFSVHKIEMCKGLFSKYDNIFREKFQLTAEELIDRLIQISETPIKNTEVIGKKFKIMESAHQGFITKLDGIKEDEDKTKYIKEYSNSTEAQQIRKELNSINNSVSLGDSIFKFNELALPKEIIEILSMELKENTQFQNGKIKYFPTNQTAIYEKPFLKVGKNYHCFNSASVYYNLQNHLEKILLSIIPHKKHQKIYYKKKGEYLEENSLEILKKILPNAAAYDNLKYGIDDEVDGLIIYDNNILIVESKSNKFTDGAKKGNLDKIKRNTKDIVEKAYQQAIRVKKYILSNKSVEFRDKNKKPVLTIEDTHNKNIYLINTTLEPLNHISADLASLKEFGFIQEYEWIWSVYLNDLRIIAEIIDCPSEFLLYLDRRIKFNDYPQIHMAEEINIFGYFLQQGLYFDDIEFPKDGFMLSIDSSYSKNIDNYYYWLEGTIKEEQIKPEFNVEKNILFLVREIESSEKIGFSDLSRLLLGFDGDTQNVVKEQLQLIRNQRRTDFHLRFAKENTGVLFITQKAYNYEKIKKQCRLYTHELKINNWYVIRVYKSKVAFELFHFEIEENTYLDIKLKELKKFRLNQTLKTRRKIGRNELCPCGSGKKYKKCCL